MRPYQVEICVDSVASAIEAEKLGADRVELCARLDLDGLTPDCELIATTREAISIDLHVIIRPRAGGFLYTEAEAYAMLKSIEDAKNLGADGIVSGALQTNGTLDVEVTKQLIEASGDCSFTFHRAFDVCAEPLKVLKQLEQIGVDRILSSGQADIAIDGVETLEQMLKTSRSIGIMAGSGVNASNVPQLWQAGIRQFHFTSHRPEADGLNAFDHNKMRLVMETLHHL